MKSEVVKSLSYATGPKPPVFRTALGCSAASSGPVKAAWASERLLSGVGGVGGTAGMLPL